MADESSNTGNCTSGPGAPHWQDWAGLRDRDLKAQDLLVAEGEYLVRRLLDSGLEILGIWLSRDKEAPWASARAARPELPWQVLEPAELRSLAGFPFHRGILALARRPQPLDGPLPARPLLCLPHIQNPLNLGTLARSCLAFGFAGLVLGPQGADPWSRMALRSSMGALLDLPVVNLCLEPGQSPAEAFPAHRVCLASLRPQAVPLATLAKSSDTRPPLLVLGHEDQGLPAQWYSPGVHEFTIPITGRVDSLGVAAAGAIALCALAPAKNTSF